MHPVLKEKLMTAEEAAELIVDGDVIGASGFTMAGYPKAVAPLIAKKARRLHAEGEPFTISLYTGASTGDEMDGELTRANALAHRIPYQSHPDLRNAINSGAVEFSDLHLSHVAQYVRAGFLKKPTVALVDAVDVTPEGHIFLSTSGGSTASYIMMADRIIIELNGYLGDSFKGFHDIFIPKPPPMRERIPIYKVDDRIGMTYVAVPMEKIVAIVETNAPDGTRPLKEPAEIDLTIAGHLVEFLKHERQRGRLPEGVPFQSGVGNVANAVLATMAREPDLGQVCLYTEVIQDSLFDLVDHDKLIFASGTALTLSIPGQERLKKEIELFRNKILLRQQEISNHPEIIRRLGIVGMNTALEFDIFGNVNSTHVLGSHMMNGIGGSADFTRNAYLPIFMSPSTAKGGDISALVPMVSHVDHSEHSTKIFVTEQGLADVRGMAPVNRARHIIDRCAHPDYKPLLTEYLEYGLKHAPSKHTPQVLSRAFEFHLRYEQTGSMLLK
ncbi:MAG: succinate CoA transferase [Deltaproteobacteria bacterium]|nr:succinate CoA transferase [Deltaproteobacteria bacterium]